MTMPPHTAPDAVWTVLSDARLGAAPVLYEVRDGVLRELARGEPIGLRHRWLNPVGAGDLDGDGELEFAWFARAAHPGAVLSGRADREPGDRELRSGRGHG